MTECRTELVQATGRARSPVPVRLGIRAFSTQGGTHMVLDRGGSPEDQTEAAPTALATLRPDGQEGGLCLVEERPALWAAGLKQADSGGCDDGDVAWNPGVAAGPTIPLNFRLFSGMVGPAATPGFQATTPGSADRAGGCDYCLSTGRSI